MSSKNKYIQSFLTVIVLVTVVLSSFQAPIAASAQGEQGDGIVRDYNAETGKVSMISGENNEPITILDAMASRMSSRQRADTLVQTFAPEFGITDPASDLQIAEQDQPSEDRVTTRYQQTYEGVPVIAGELIVNANDQGALSSMSGEVAQGLSLDTNPTITSEQAVEIAQQGMVKWYGGEAASYVSTESTLSIFDEKLLRPSIRPAELVWKIEMVSADQGQPLQEFVVVNAQTGNIPMHFNQIDTAWHDAEVSAGVNQPPQQEEVTPTPTTTEITITATPVPTEIIQATSTPENLLSEEPSDLNAQAGPYYVNIATGNNSNSCTSVAAPCKNIQEAINKASSGDTVYVANGTYVKSINPNPNVLQIDKSLTLSGGWDATFTTQSGASTINGANTNNGILVTTGTVTVKNFIIQNSISSDSGAIYLVAGTFTLEKSTLKSNTAANRGAGIYIGSSVAAVNIINSTISGNTASSGGGGIYSGAGSATITIESSTIANNMSSTGGGINRNAGTFVLKNSIVANNSGSVPDCSGLLSSVTYSLIENMSGCTITTSSNNLNVDPQISSSLSGPMQVHGVLTGSPVINAGTTTGCPLTDQRGVTRPQGASCEMGALEYVAAGPPNSIEVSSGSQQSVPPFSVFGSPLIALVKDSNDFGVSGVTVTFSAPASGASGTFANTSSHITTAVTDESGYATASTFTANNTSGNYMVETTVSGVGTAAQFSLENYPATATTISVSSGSGQSVYTSAVYPNPLKVLVLDQYSAPLVGATVTFTAPASGASAVFSNTGNNVTTAITSASGIATSANFTANATGGAYIVEASVAGIASPANFSLTSVPAPLPQYVAPSGVDSSSCSNLASPCLTIDYAISKATTDAIIYVAKGTYTSSQSRVVYITKSLTLSGGWNSSFTTQSGFSIIDGQLARHGIYVNSSGAAVFITNFVIQNGSTTLSGGGIYNSSGNLTVSNSTIKNNFAGQHGGGISSSSTLTLNNVTISNNSASSSHGGGIYQDGIGALTILNSTVANNKTILSANGAGLHEQTSGTVTVRNSIIANNIEGTDCSGTINVSQNNLFGSLDECIRTSSSGDLVNVDPMIPSVISGHLLALRTGSPAIDAGNAATCLGTDERGLARPQGGVCDIGAYERPSTIGPAAALTVLAGSGQQSEVLFTFPTRFSVFVTDADGDPIQSETITFTAPADGASGTFANTSSNVTTASTDADGIASPSAYTANNSAGSYTLQATASGAPPANFQLQNFIRVPTAVVVQSGSPQAAAGGFAFNWPIVVSVRDQHSVPMKGITVTFTAPASGSSGVFTGTGTNVSSVLTDSSGLAIAPTLTANTTTGTFQVNATVVGVASPAVFQLTNGNGRFVSTTGTDASTCTISASPCRTIQYAVGQAQSGNSIYVTEGVYTSTDPTQVVNITKNIILSGGWNSTFTSQLGYSTIDGQGTRRGVNVGNYVVFIGRFHIVNGYSSTFAGGINAYGTLTLENVAITNNKAVTLGGAINNNGTLIINNSTFAENQASEGGAIQNSMIATLNNVTLSENQAARGGALENTGTLTLNNVTLSDNQAVEIGGAIYQRSNALYIANSTLSRNYAGQQGGGIYIIDGSVSINNSTIYQNYVTNLGTAAIGGGIANENKRPLFIKNTILAGNAGEYIPDCLGPVTSEGHNLIGYAAGCDVTASTGDLIGFNDPINAMLGDLADNGGSTQTHVLLSGSPAINAGDPLTCKTGDQRGVARPQGSACDIGAFEGSSAGSSTAMVQTYTAANETTFPGTFLCAASTPLCTNGANPHADAAHKYALGVYDFYLDNFGRHSIDNNNMPIISTVHYKPSYDNAYWTGAQMVYGDVRGFPLADDVVAHELTHGVTDYESRLYYYYQSGAINESLSDIFGEFYDQTNGLGTDTPAVKWLHAEDVQPGGTGAFRNMKNPPAFNDPDKMSSPYYITTYTDSGGVHSNSGVNNKAAYLMVDGDTFNGITVTGIGWEKTAAIYYEVQTHLLFSGADYSDLYYALQQACTTLSLTNVEGITSQDCVQVKNALDAVEMNSSPTPEYNPDPAACPAGTYTTPALTVFEDDFENGTGNWKMTENWSLTDFYAGDPTHSMWADDYETSTRSDLTTKNGYLIPPGNTYLYFKHAFDFDYYGDHYYDGGLLEYSVDNGSTWGNAKQLYSAGKNYGGTLMSGFGNPLSSKWAFVGESHGYVASQFNLGSLAGHTVKLRWSMGTDNEYSYLGWLVDDVRIYRCTGEPMTAVNALPANGSVEPDLTPTLSWETLPYDGYLHLQVATDDTFASPIYDLNNVVGPQWTVPANLSPETTYYWRVRSYNWFDETDDWSTPTSFRTTVSPPVLIYPAVYYQNVLNNRLLFDWSDVPNATSYRIQAWNNYGSYVDTVVTDSYYQIATDLPAGAGILWQVFANGVDGPSAPSGSYFYTAYPPSMPVLVAPANNSLKTTPTLKLDWNASVPQGTRPVSHYELQVAADQAFSSLLFTQNNIVPSDFTLSVPLPSSSNIYWRVRTYNNLGEYTNWSKPFYFRTFYLAPTLTTIPTPLTNNRPLFDWSDITGTTSYTLQVSTANTFTSFALNTVVNGSAYTSIVDLPANKTLYWRVNALGAYGPSAWSAVSSFSTANPPSVPALVLPADKSLSTDYTPRLDWANSTVPLLTSFDAYHIQIATDAAFSNLVDEQNIAGILNSEYTPSTDLPANTTYYWRVRSLNSNGHASAWSLVRSFRTALLIPQPALPTNGTSLLGNRPTFDWDDAAGATSYSLQISTVNTFSSFVLKATANTSSYTHTADLPVNKTLYWRVIANGVNGPSLPSAYFTLTTVNPPSVPILAAPAENLLITNTLTPKLDWNNATAPTGTSFDHYQLLVATDSAFSNVVLDQNVNNISTSEFTLISALSQNTKYYWRVRSHNSLGQYSSWSLTRSFRIALPAPALALPAAGAALQPNRPTFDWNDVAGATGYTVQISTANTFATTLVKENTTGSSYTPIKDLPANKTLYWRVISNAANGPSLPSAYFSFTTANPPSVPVLVMPAENLLITNTLTPKLDWNNSTLPAGVSFGRYQLQVATDAGFSSVELDQDITVSEFTLISPLSQNTKYYWRVRSYDNADHFSSWSLVRSFRMVMASPSLIAPTGGQLTNRPTFNWNAVAGATSYTVQVSTVSTFATFVLNTSAAGPGFTPKTNLPVNKTLYWRVIANGTNGPSLPSNALSFTTSNPPTVPALVAPTENLLITSTLTPKLDWANSTAPAGTSFDHYQLQVAADAAFSAIVLDQNVSGIATSEFTLVSPLLHNTKYYWRVRSYNGLGQYSGWSLVRSFRVVVDVPILASPTGSLPLTDLTPVFEWDDVAGAAYYSIQISTTNTFTTTVVNTTASASTFTPTANLPTHTALYWRVLVQGAHGPGSWSPPSTFIIQ